MGQKLLLKILWSFTFGVIISFYSALPTFKVPNSQGVIPVWNNCWKISFLVVPVFVLCFHRKYLKRTRKKKNEKSDCSLIISHWKQIQLWIFSFISLITNCLCWWHPLFNVWQCQATIFVIEFVCRFFRQKKLFSKSRQYHRNLPTWLHFGKS